MKIIENEEFFDLFNDKAWTFDQWVATFEKLESKQNLLNHLSASSFIEQRAKSQLTELKYKHYLLVVTADWCGDCQRSVPVLEHIVKSNEHLKVKYLKKEDNLDLIIPTNGSQKIPYVMFYSQDGYYVSNWVERPYYLYNIISGVMKKFNYEKNEEFFKAYKEVTQMDKSLQYESTCDEIIHTILKVNAIQGSSARINSKE